MSERRYNVWEDPATLGWFAGAFAMGFGSLVGSFLIWMSELRGPIVALPFVFLTLFVMFLSNAKARLKRGRLLYEHGIEVQGTVIDLNRRGATSVHVEYFIGGRTVIAHVSAPPSIVESLEIDGPVRLLVNPAEPTHCLVLG